jgi:hypothetical protein
MSGPGLNLPPNDPRMPALRRLRPPAFILLCVGVLNIFFWVVGITLALLNIHIIPVPPGVDPSNPLQSWQILLTITGAVIAGAVSIWAAMSAFNLRSWGLVVVGSVTAMLPLAPACCMGLPVGAWLLFVLNAPEVKQHFT